MGDAFSKTLSIVTSAKMSNVKILSWQFNSTARYLDDLLNIDIILSKGYIRYIPPNFS